MGFVTQTKSVEPTYKRFAVRLKDFDKYSFKGPITIKPVFPIRPNPKLCQIWKGDLYEIQLSLLCETMTLSASVKLSQF